MAETNKPDLSPCMDSVKKLLSTIGDRYVSGAKLEQAKIELERAACFSAMAAEILNILISGLLFTVRNNEENRVSRAIHQLEEKYRGQPDGRNRAWTEACFPLHMCDTLSKMEDIPEQLRDDLVRAAPAVLRKLSDEELAIVLVSAETPGWLCKTILSSKRSLALLANSVYIPCQYLTHAGLNDDGYYKNDGQNTTHMPDMFARAKKALDWFYHTEQLPVRIDPCPVEMQNCATRTIGLFLKDWPLDKLLALISADFFPVWLRKAAENAFARRAADGTATARLRRAGRRKRRQGKTDTSGH